jgi:uncharacterized protein involved in exopolysaccharide biosynthesis
MDTTLASIPPPEPRGLDLRRLMAAVWRERRLVMLATLIATLVTLGIAFLLPPWYKATVVILPPEESDLMANMALAQRALTRFPAFGILEDYFTPADIYKAVLGSRTVQEEVIAKFDLQKVYKIKSREKTVKEFKTHYKVKLNPDGTIQVSVEDRSPVRAAEMANTMMVLLDRFNVEKRNYQARRTREFLEQRVHDTDSLLRVSEAVLRAYQEQHHTVAPPTTQAAGDMQSVADLMARKIMLEVRLGMLKSYLRGDNDQVIQTSSELEQLNEKIATLPQLQTEIQRLMRDNKVQEQLYLLLIAELEQARIRETMDTPTVEILDPAQPPERHSRPRRAILALAAGMVAFVGSVVWVAWREGSDPTAPA